MLHPAERDLIAARLYYKPLIEDAVARGDWLGALQLAAALAPYVNGFLDNVRVLR